MADSLDDKQADPRLAPSAVLRTTPLHALHRELGAKMVPFAGYDMPVQYPMGVLKEHLWTRAHAGLFDVSHMGQAFLVPEDKDYATAARFLETLVPADLQALKPGQQRYSQLLAADGGILDDLMATRLGFEGHHHWLYLVVNAACKEADFAHLAAHLPGGLALRQADTMALLALQGPKAATVLTACGLDVGALAFMTAIDAPVGGIWCHVSRSGYTGEDGFEISVKNHDAVALWQLLSQHADVAPIGLGARDSLRLEAGLCLYGHDIDSSISPIEADLAWSIQKRRRLEGSFPGAERIQRELATGPARRRVGILPEGRAPAREGSEIRSVEGALIGRVTSGGFGPTLNGPLAMGLVDTAHAAPGTHVQLIVRDKPLPARSVTMPFVPHRYVRKPTA
jgi:aminomethyltransferase